MDFIQIVILAILQGLTEFLPISSSAHLILFPRLAGWDDQGLAFDVAVKDGRIKTGDLVLMEAMGGGFTWGAVLARL